MTALLAVSCGRKTGDGPTVSRFDGFTQGTSLSYIGKKRRAPTHGKRDRQPADRGRQLDVALQPDNRCLSRLNRNETDSVDGFIAELYPDRRRRISREQSDGAVTTSLIKPLTAAYGFTGDRTGTKPRRRFAAASWSDTTRSPSTNGRLARKPILRMQIDLNSIAQGATSDYIAALFRKTGNRRNT